MKNPVYIILPNVLKKLTPIDQNVDNDILKYCIIQAQEIYIKPRLKYLYSDIIENIKNNTLSEDYQYLIDNYLADCVIQFSLYKYAIYSTYKLKNSGISKENYSEREIATMSELNMLKEDSFKSAELCMSNMIEYIEDNPTLFPVYQSTNNTSRGMGIIITRKRTII